MKESIFRLPSGRKICLTDTIGFLSDLPIHLIDAFEATLAHVKKAVGLIISCQFNPVFRRT